MSDYDIHSCGYYCDRPACIKAQRDEMRDGLFSEKMREAMFPYQDAKPTEPVAYINVQERKLEWATPIKWETPTVVKMDKIPLYTKEEWVGLTDEELEFYTEELGQGELGRGVLRAVDDFLKEKNT